MKLIVPCLIAGTLLLAGCSYTPARLETRPLIEIDGHGHHGHRDHDRYEVRRYEERHYEGHRRHHRDRYHDHRGGFCPPGQAMKGRC